jgi:hypothetical protein
MTPLTFLVDAFVNTFGITRPSAAQQATAGRYIAAMLAAVALAFGAVAWLLHSAVVPSRP